MMERLVRFRIGSAHGIIGARNVSHLNEWRNARFWHEADLPFVSINVHFWG